MKIKKRILISPLNWGLGHASRCIPIIHDLIKNNFEVIIAAEGRSYKLLKNEFSDIEFISINGVEIRYSKYIPMHLSILIQFPRILYGIYNEHQIIKEVITQHKIDGIISDSRFGLWHKNVKSVFMTHQLEIQSAVFKKILQKINYWFINKFTECWIIDDLKYKLSGSLASPCLMPKRFKYIGCVSRLTYKEEVKIYDICCIISGPEKQRTYFETIILESIKKINKKTIIILGKTEEDNVHHINNTTIISSANTKQINKYILESKIIISRSGYSTVMDLFQLRAKAIFIPTPGQTEQEYIAKRLKDKGICYYQDQNDFDLSEAINKSEQYSGFQLSKNINKQKKSLFSLF